MKSQAVLFDSIILKMGEWQKYRASLFESNNGLEDQREQGVPVGLKNVGNTCFINSLLQCYFMIPPLVKEIMLASFSKERGSSSPGARFVRSLQFLFAEMIGTKRKYANPSDTLNSLVDSAGKKIVFGDQQDIGEFHLIFVENIEKGLKECLQESNPLWKSMKEKGEIDMLFMGTHKEVLRFKEGEGEERKTKSIKKRERFGQIILDLGEGDLYSAWESSNTATISGFKAESEEVVKAKQEIWIETLPKVLMFQIKRHFFIAGDPAPMKNNSIFKFPEILYPERMLWKNRAQVKSLRKEAKGCKSDIKSIKSKIRSLCYPNSENLRTQDSVNSLINFLGTPVSQELQNEEEIFKLLKSLEHLQSNLEEKLQILQDRQKELELKLSSQYECLQDQRYDLHSILIHEGAAISGHYYAFIKDLDSDIWRKYNDSFVSTVGFESVKKCAEGGTNTMASAYCLVYINHNIIENPSGMRRISYLAEESIGVSDEYSTYVREGLAESIFSQNRMDAEIRESKDIEPIILSIQEDYIKRIASCKKTVSANFSSKLKWWFLSIANLAIYLAANNRADLSEWCILDSLVVKYHGIKLRDLKDGVFKRKLFEKIKQSAYPVPRISLSVDDLSLFDRLHSNYIQAAADADIVLCMLDSINNYTDVFLHASFLYFQINRSGTCVFTKDVVEALHIITLSSICELYQMCVQNNIQMVKEVCDKIHVILFNISDSPFHKEFVSLILLIRDKYAKQFNKKDRNEFAEAFKKAVAAEINYEFLESVPEKIEELKGRIVDMNYYECRSEEDGINMVNLLRYNFALLFDENPLYRKAANLYTSLRTTHKLDIKLIENLKG